MNVCLASYQSAMLLKGGPRTQILQTKRCLEQLGVNVTLFESWQEFPKEKIDIVHLFGANIGTYHLARELHKIQIPIAVTPIFYTRHLPVVVRVASIIDSMVRSVSRGLWTDYGMIAEICSWADVLLPNTLKEAALFQRGFGIERSRITVIPNGVEERFYHASPETFVKQYGIKDFILNVGHIGPKRKNVLRLIQALENINHPAVIIGRIEENAYGRECVEQAKRNPRLLMIDSLPNDADLLASAYAAADVFTLPSQFETPGIAALEAGLAGAKVVITKHGGTEDYFGSYAEYVDPTSWELIHHGIISALNKPKDNLLREHLRKEFLWESVARKTKQVYETIAR